jgi:phenylacetate-coenzyme A ligase PaaK-like adenylate-forming protein
MAIKSFLAKIYARKLVRKLHRQQLHAIGIQAQILADLIKKAKHTSFGLAHQFDQIANYETFKSLVPVRDYEDFQEPFLKDLIAGKPNVLWPGKPIYFCKTSGTTSGVKYIPITKDSMQHHITAAKTALLCYINETGNADFLNGKLIFLQGSPLLNKKSGIATGRLSGIVAHHVPAYLQANRLPSFETNCIEDWETKLDAIVAETFHQDMTLISGIPPWVQMYFDKLIQQSNGQAIKDIFKNFSLFVYGGVNFEPYRAKIEQSIGKKIDTIETYPASEGFIAFQDTQNEAGLLLNINAGIFFEFIPVENYFDDQPKRLTLADIELEKNYALILTTNAGLWAYSIGDTVKFVSKSPYRIKVTGRIKHFISAFGEHVIGEEVEYALMTAAKEINLAIAEFTVAPQVNPLDNGLPYHEWFIETEQSISDLTAFAARVDELLQTKNVYYKDLINGKVLRTLQIKILPAGTFINYMKKEGKLGGQNKVPRLSNDRKIADQLIG